MLGNVVKLKTETRTLEQIQEILSTNPQGQDLINAAIIDAIAKLHTKLAQEGHPTLLLVDEDTFKVNPKKEYKQFMRDLTGESGPYKVTKTYKSWVGLSEGVYEIEGTDKFIPVSWCSRSKCSKHLTALNIFLAISSVLQSGLILALLLV